MYCRYCGSDMPEGENLCTACGKKNNDNSIWKLLVVILCGLVLVAVLTVAVLMAIGVINGKDDAVKGNDPTTLPSISEQDPTQAPTQNPTEQTEPVETEPPLLPLGKSYSAEDAQVKAAAGEIVATIGEQTLTNEQLQIFYWNQVYSFLYNYGTYYFDISAGLDTQDCMVDTSMTWQEYFLTQAIKTWQSYAVLLEQARVDGYEFGEDVYTYLANLPQTAAEEAVEYGYTSLEEMVLKETGAGVTVDGFIAYRGNTHKAVQYFNSIYAGMTPTAEEVEARFEENQEYYAGNNVTKDSGKYVDVRHILIAFQTDEGAEGPTDEQKQAAKDKAEQIYNEWKNGEATEDSFAALAGEHTEDPGSKADGGLYTQVSQGQMVETFDAWIMDQSRVKGDHGIVETDFGYHIMYYVDDQPVWYGVAEQDILTERFDTFYSTVENAYPLVIFADKMVLGVVNLTQE